MRVSIYSSIRLSISLVILGIVLFVLSSVLPKTQISPGYLVLFAVSVVLLGFYLLPLLASRKTRIDEIDKYIRLEADMLYKVLIELEDLPANLREELGLKVKEYIMRKAGDYSPDAGDAEYREVLVFCRQHRKNPEIKAVYDKLLDSDQYRTLYAMCVRDQIYSHEWFVISILYVVAVPLILTFDYGGGFLARIAGAFVAAGLILPFLILKKLSSLAHKKAQSTWQPFTTLAETDFREFNAKDAAK